MAAETKQINAVAKAKIAKLETDLKLAFKEGRLETAKKRADELLKLDAENHLGKKIMSKIQEEEAERLKKANVEKVKTLETKMNQFFKAGDLPKVNEEVSEIQRLDPQNKKAQKMQEAIQKAKVSVEGELRKEKIKRLENEIQFFMNKADLNSSASKANELLALQWGNSTAMKALEKAAKAKKVDVKILMTAQGPTRETKSGFFARLFGPKQPAQAFKPEPKKAEAPKVAPAAKPALSEVLQKVAPILTQAPMPSRAPVAPALPPLIKPLVSTPVTPAPVLKPIVPTTPPSAPVFKPAIFTPPKAAMPVSPTLKPASVVPITLKMEQKAVVTPQAKMPEGNIFTKLFGPKAEAPMAGAKSAGSIIETIVTKTSKEEMRVEKKAEEGTGELFLRFSGVFLNFSLLFILASAGFLYVQNMDTQNRFLSLVGKENQAIMLHNAAQSLDTQKQEENKLTKEIEKYKGGYEDESRKTIENIVQSRMDWPEILKKLNAVTESVYEKNALSQYVQYNNYSYDTETGRFTVSATLSDPLGKNLTKLAELEEAFKNYPHDPANPEDGLTPYFFGVQDFKAFAKNFNAATGRFQSNFTLTLFTKEQPKK